MRRLALAMSLAMTALACTSGSSGSAAPPDIAPTTTSAAPTPTTAASVPTTSTTAPATTTTTDDGEQTIAEREAELIELIAANATGPEEWVLIAARAVAAEQLILERPGEINLLDYFTEDSPYLEETIRPAVDEFTAGGWTLEGLLVVLKSATVRSELEDRVVLELVLLDASHLVRAGDDEVLFEREGGDLLRVHVVITTESGGTRVHDRVRIA